MEQNRPHTALHSTSRVAGPAQRPGINEVHGAAVPSPGAGVSPGEVVVVAMGPVAAAVAIPERDGPCISCQNHRQSPKDRGDGQNVHDLLPRKGLVDQLRAALVDPRLWRIPPK